MGETLPAPLRAPRSKLPYVPWLLSILCPRRTPRPPLPPLWAPFLGSPHTLALAPQPIAYLPGWPRLNFNEESFAGLIILNASAQYHNCSSTPGGHAFADAAAAAATDDHLPSPLQSKKIVSLVAMFAHHLAIIQSRLNHHHLLKKSQHPIKKKTKMDLAQLNRIAFDTSTRLSSQP
ncbi:unnamed protein product [Trichogramma brassicae]|uniref:Uncharacterized protein n=1 Tax=Trichogramma brassicae TaxID=86971 RepID=A0A6H5HX51_9HYME|nr:unnamed protein product [Trichogramma brassicae]